MCYYHSQKTNYNYQNYVNGYSQQTNGYNYQNSYYNNYNPYTYYGSYPIASFNRGIDPLTNAPAYGNIGVGNGLAAFYLYCHNCGRTG